MLLCMVLSLSLSRAGAQFICSPQVTATNFYISNVMFNYSGAGLTWPTGNNGYSANVSASSKTIPRYYAHTATFWFELKNTSAAAITVYFRFFADWNQNGGFTDGAYEMGNSVPVIIPANSSTGASYSMAPPVDAKYGFIRVRLVVSQNSNLTDPCGTIAGEVEDYKITVLSNSAPVMPATASIFMNPMLTTQTASEGFSVNQIITGSQPETALITDADDSTGYYVPRGIAIYGVGGTGYWQYKTTSSDAWANLGLPSPSSAMLLLGDSKTDTRYQPGARLRFLPTGPGNAGITFQAWDGTSSGPHGSFNGVMGSGGVSAFSTVARGINIPVTTVMPTHKFYLASPSADNIIAAPFNPATGVAYDPAPIVSNNTNLTNITDMDLDVTNNKLVWTESAAVDKIVSANMDGSNVTVLYTFPNTASDPRGIAFGGGRMYYTDNGGTGKGIYKANLNGTGRQLITGGAGQLPTPTEIKDIEYYNNKLYVAAGPVNGFYNIYQIDTTGANPVVVIGSTSNIEQLDVKAGMVFWTENGTTSRVQVKLLSQINTITLVSANNRTFRDIQLDSANSRVYYLDEMPAANRPSDRYLMYVPLAGGLPVKVLNLPEAYTSLVSAFNPASLAITLEDFNGKALAKTNRLQWLVGSEGPGARYSLERSADGTSFVPLAVIAGAKARQYQYEDASPLQGTSFYRLHLQDDAGEDSYSKTIALQRGAGNNNTVVVYPNPAKDVLQVLGAEVQLLELYNIMGQKVAGSGGMNMLSLAHLPAGIYNLRITLAGSQEVISEKVIKQ
ncbi:GEVED domain-containing protein [Taibaiella chishuiensis]|nr:GEVED domain-containing protein [Taibaiella chishuiensis]